MVIDLPDSGINTIIFYKEVVFLLNMMKN